MSTVEAHKVLAFDNPPYELRELFTEGLLRDLVTITTRDSLVDRPHPGNLVMVVEVTGLPVEAWSTGERVLWDFCLSLAGQPKSETNFSLFDLMSFFKGSAQGELIANAFAAFMGVQRG
jgi:hypothetical protein